MSLLRCAARWRRSREARGKFRLTLLDDAAAMSYSFGVLVELSAPPRRRSSPVVDSIKETLAKLAPVAHFETTVDGFTAKTVINYSGFAASVWSSGTTAELVDAHLESLREGLCLSRGGHGGGCCCGQCGGRDFDCGGNPLTVWHAVKSAEALKSAVDRLAAAVAAHAQSASADSLACRFSDRSAVIISSETPRDI